MRSTSSSKIMRIAFALAAAVVVSCALNAVALPTEQLDRRLLDLSSLIGTTDKSTDVYTASASTKSVGPAPAGAFGTTFKLSKGDLFAWQSKTPHNVADTEVVAIVIHGVDRDADNYFKAINDAYRSARGKQANAPVNTLRIAPEFFATPTDDKTLNASTLAWTEDNNWSVGYGSLHPSGSDMSSFTVLDELISQFSNRGTYPKVRNIVLVGHGGGGMLISRYAALRNGGNPSGVSLRYVIGNPSAMLYFTSDRYKSIDENSCSYYNDYFYGLESYDAPYDLAGKSQDLFKTFAARDVRYLISLDDTSTTNGDQSCGARAQGGAKRKDRSLSYWKYINLLAGASASSLSKFPGAFASMQNNAGLGAYRISSKKVSHQLTQLNNVGHEAYNVITSSQGQSAIFG